MLSNQDKQFIRDVVERMSKTFFQAYFAAWTLIAFVGTGLGNAGAFDSLFTMNNVKAGVVGAALSFFTSIGSRPVGDQDSASLVE